MAISSCFPKYDDNQTDVTVVHAYKLMSDLLLPEPSLRKLSFCSGTKTSKVAEWASFVLPNKPEISGVKLYQALPEINQLKCSPDSRYEMLEAIRPTVLRTINNLSKQFLAQSIPLPEKAQKSFVIAQALHKRLVEGYSLTIKQGLSSKKRFNPVKDEYIVSAVHRCITHIGHILLLNAQTYSNSSKGMWQQLHILYRIAEENNILAKTVTDEEQESHKTSSIKNAYLQNILLACSSVRQLNQTDIKKLHTTFLVWTNHVVLSPKVKDNFFYINLERDQGPKYQNRMSEEESNDLKVELNLGQLIHKIDAAKPESISNKTTFHIPKSITSSLIEHLKFQWLTIPSRQHDRRPVSSTAELSIGINNVHAALCNGLSFNEFLPKSLRSPTKTSNQDTQTLVEPNPTKQAIDDKAHEWQIQNIGLGGYCFYKKTKQPLKLRGGDVIAIKEKNKSKWVIGTIRWIKQAKFAAKIGVKILSTNAKPYAMSQKYDMGGQSDFMRAIYAYGSDIDNTQESIITAPVPFRANDRVQIYDGDKKTDTQLKEQVLSTTLIRQLVITKEK